MASLGVGLALRCWGLGFGLPHTGARPDESLLVHRALAISAGDLNPHFFNYPSLQIYLLAAVCGGQYLVERVVGGLAGTQDFLLRFFVDPTQTYVAARLLTVLMGTATIALAHRMGRSVAGPTAGACAAVLLAGAFLHVRDSHFATVDVPAAFWSTAALAALLHHVRAGGWRSLLAGAALAGLAASTKYNASLFVPALLLAAVLGESGVACWRRAALAAGVWIVAFAAGSPFVFLDPVAFWRDFSFEWHHFGRGHGIDLGNGWLHHLTFSLRHGMGWPLLATALAALVWLARRRHPVDLILLTGVLSYFAVAGSGGSLFVRYIVPLVPVLCVVAGAGVARALGGRAALAIPAAVLIISPSLASSLVHDRLLTRTDTRVLATEWIESHVPASQTVAFTGSVYGHPRLRPTHGWIATRLHEVRRAGAEGRRLQLQLDLAGYPPPPAYELVVLRPDNPQRLSSVLPPMGIDELIQRGVEWLVVQSHPLAYAGIPHPLAEELDRLQAEVDFDPFQHSVPTVYDPIDAYYAPYAAHSGVHRPGPRLRVYHLKTPSMPGL